MNALLRCLDKTLGLLLYRTLPTEGGRTPQNRQNKKILCIKLWAIGESLLVLPVIKSIKHMTGAHITIAVSQQNRAIFNKQPFVDEIIILNPKNPFQFIAKCLGLRRKGFDAAVDFEPFTYFSAVLSRMTNASLRIGFENRPRLYTTACRIDEEKHATENFARLALAGLGIKSRIEPVKIFSSRHERMQAEKFIKSLKKPVAAIHAGSSSTSPSRRWSEERFAALCDALSDMGFSVALVGSAAENAVNESIISHARNKSRVANCAGKLSLGALAAFFEHCALVIANDSGPMHLAGSAGAPTIGLFGPNAPERYGALGNFIGIRKDGEICIKPFRGQFPDCRHRHMEKITVDDVIKAAKKVWSYL